MKQIERQHVDVFNIPFINIRFDDMVCILADRIENEERTFVVTGNPEIVMQGEENSVYKRHLMSADYIVPDGVGILIASKIFGTPLKERVTGYDLMMKLLELANFRKWKVYFLGGSKEANEKACKRVKRDFPKIKIVGSHHGYFDWSKNKPKQEIEQLEPDIIFVALGMPRQEIWIGENITDFKKGIFIGVGGSIDVLAGNVKRAPEIWQKLKIEWLYRLIKQPSRWRRMLALPRFMMKVLKVKWGK